MKLNYDVAWVMNTWKGGTRVVARDWEGKIIVRKNSTSKDTSAKNLEAKVIYHVVELVIYHKWKDVIIELDAKGIIQMLKVTKQGVDWDIQNLMTYIIEMARNILSLKWDFFCRSVNRCANWDVRKYRHGMCLNN